MKIIYDHQIFTKQTYGGISRYHCELIKQFNKNNHDVSVPVLLSKNRMINPSITGMNYISTKLSNKYIDKLAFELNSRHTISLLKNKTDFIFHPTYHSVYYRKYIKSPIVLTVHDLIHEKLFAKSAIVEKYIKSKRESIERADHIIAISENTKFDLIDYYNVLPEKISVIYHGTTIIEDKGNTPFTYDRDYILYVGDREGYKNFSYMLQSISAKLIEFNIDLICCGTPFNKEELTLIRNLKVENRIKQIRPNESQLQKLYRNAILFIYPSIYEGFGLPILEAFSNNCPVCTSETSCMPEIAQDAALYFDPHNKETIIYAIEKVVTDNQTRNDLINKGQERASYFTWENTYKNTLNIYKNIL